MTPVANPRICAPRSVPGTAVRGELPALAMDLAEPSVSMRDNDEPCCIWSGCACGFR
jgi:hypothetical protein